MINKLLVSGAGIAGVQVTPIATDTISNVVDTVGSADVSGSAGIIQVVIQIAIGIVTLFKILKEKKDAKRNGSKSSGE